MQTRTASCTITPPNGTLPNTHLYPYLSETTLNVASVEHSAIVPVRGMEVFSKDGPFDMIAGCYATRSMSTHAY